MNLELGPIAEVGVTDKESGAKTDGKSKSGVDDHRTGVVPDWKDVING